MAEASDAPSASTPTSSSGSPASVAVTKAPGSAPGAGSSPASSGALPPPDSRVVASEAPKPAELTAEQKKRAFRLKVDGSEVDYDLDAKSDEELQRDLQLSLAARRRMDETAAEKKKLREVVNLFKSDPWSAAKELGVDLEAMAEQRLGAKFRELTMPEEERAKLVLERERDEFKRKVADLEAANQKRAQEELQAKVFQELQGEVKTAFETAGVPWTPHTARLMGEIAQSNLQFGVELSPKQLANELKSQLTGIASEVLKALKGDDLLSFLGPDAVREVLKVSVAKVRQPVATQGTSPAPTKNGDPDLDDRGRVKRAPADYRKTVQEMRWGA